LVALVGDGDAHAVKFNVEARGFGDAVKGDVRVCGAIALERREMEPVIPKAHPWSDRTECSEQDVGVVIEDPGSGALGVSGEEAYRSRQPLLWLKFEKCVK